ncbi:MAG: polysaccharide biosynthesis tyrosine autokinase [Bacteroidales bacterium]|nr:polysaccharide biosynthesis tyrosine autokinase [Bacteroidales bacterium]
MDKQNTYGSNSNSQDQSQSNVEILEILKTCLRKWYWFALSLVLTLSIGCLKILKTIPLYERSSTILIKEQLNRRASGNDLDMLLSTGGANSMASRLANEVIAFVSPALMTEVVSRLGLQTEYSVEGNFHPTILYGDQVPLEVKFVDNPSDVSVKFLISSADEGRYSISKLSYFDKETRKKVTVKTPTYHCMGDTVDIGIARIVVSPAQFFTGEWKHPLKVTRRSMYSATRLFSSRLSADSVDEKKRCDVLVLRLQDYNINRADNILNMLINVYNENWVDDKNKMAISTSRFINDRLQVIEKELGTVDESISEYKSKNLLPDVQSVSSMYMSRSTETARKIQEIENQLYVTKFVRSYLEGNSNDISQLIPMASSIQHSGIAAQITEYNNVVLKRNNLVSNSSEMNPLAISLSDALKTLRTGIVSAIDNQIETLEAQIDILRKEDQKTNERIAASPSQAKYLLTVERQQKVKESLYLFLLQKREENELSQAFTAYNTRIITPPGGSLTPIAPISRNILLIAFVLGLCIPFGIIYLLEVTNTRLRGRKDLENLTIPFLGEIPQYLSPEERKKSRFHRFATMLSKNLDKSSIVIRQGKRDVINEAFRVLRTNLEFISQDVSDGARIQIVTSCNPGSGKTFLCINTAVSLAIKGLKVLCIDGDLRHASLSQIVSSPSRGISDFLSGREKDIEQLIVRNFDTEGLDIIPVGTLPPNPSELLANPRFTSLISELRSCYDYVFIDCPPVDIVTDTQIIQGVADRTLFVVRSGVLERSMLPEIQRFYDNRRFKNMCIVLNGTDMSGSRYSSRYGYYNATSGKNYYTNDD